MIYFLIFLCAIIYLVVGRVIAKIQIKKVKEVNRTSDEVDLFIFTVFWPTIATGWLIKWLASLFVDIYY